jgi:hypothetical protein
VRSMPFIIPSKLLKLVIIPSRCVTKQTYLARCPKESAIFRQRDNIFKRHDKMNSIKKRTVT